MSCSARLPVYVLFIGAFVPDRPLLGGVIGLQALTLLAFYCLGALIAIPVAWLLKRTLLKAIPPPFLLELPSYKTPDPRTVLLRVYHSSRALVVRAAVSSWRRRLQCGRWRTSRARKPWSSATKSSAKRSRPQPSTPGKAPGG